MNTKIYYEFTNGNDVRNIAILTRKVAKAKIEKMKQLHTKYYNDHYLKGEE